MTTVKTAPVSGVVITPEMESNIATITEQQQLEMATNLMNALEETFGVEDICALDILDALGSCGLSLTIGEWASHTYLSEMSKLDEYGFPISGEK